jgi:hypothetical protein
MITKSISILDGFGNMHLLPTSITLCGFWEQESKEKRGRDVEHMDNASSRGRYCRKTYSCEDCAVSHNNVLMFTDIDEQPRNRHIFTSAVSIWQRIQHSMVGFSNYATHASPLGDFSISVALDSRSCQISKERKSFKTYRRCDLAIQTAWLAAYSTQLYR